LNFSSQLPIFAVVELLFATNELVDIYNYSKKLCHMHTYAMKDCARERYILYMVLLAIPIFGAVQKFAGLMGLAVSVGTISIFGGIYFVFDRWAWRMPIFSRLAGIPNLQGNWTVTGQTSGADGQPREWAGTARITQTWSHISISIDTEMSRSRSGMAAVECDHGHGFRVVYAYVNEPKGTECELYSHRGTCQVVFSADLVSGDGTYFNDHQRRTFGTMTWKRLP
jgi:hypothetical protein